MITHSRSWSAITVLAFVALMIIILISTHARAAGPWYVAPGGNDGNSCLSAGSPCATINGAIGKATSGDIIYVAIGTYTNSTGSEVVLIDKSTTLSGGWDAAFTTHNGMSTIDGGGSRRGITSNSGVTAIIERLVIQNGSSEYGGGIYTEGTLTLNNSTVRGNLHGGIYNHYGTVTLNNSTISGNLSSLIGGAGGGIYNNDGIVTLNNSTVSNNTAYSGGGIFNESGTVTLQNSILAGNTADVVALGPDCAGPHNSAGYNLIGNTTGCTFNSTTGDLLNTNPMISVLIGSPGYHPLLPGSPAIDTGNPATPGSGGNACEATDQRGVARVGRCDINAYEFDPNDDPIQVFLPLISKLGRDGIYGLVTLNGNPIAGVSLDLWFYNGSSWSILATTTTGADGYYAFLNAPGLGAGQKYLIYYSNTGGTPGRLWFWRTPELTSYSAGSAVAMGDFDIADIALVYPDDGATVSLPITFQWTLRPTTPSDNYKLRLYDPTDENHPWILWTVGYVNNFTLGGLPPIFSPGVQYAWEISVYSPDGGFGVSYDWHYVTFSNSGMSSPAVLQPTQPKTVPDLEGRRKR